MVFFAAFLAAFFAVFFAGFFADRRDGCLDEPEEARSRELDDRAAAAAPEPFDALDFFDVFDFFDVLEVFLDGFDVAGGLDAFEAGLIAVEDFERVDDDDALDSSRGSGDRRRFG